jgi:hypothetical protein
LHAGGCSRLGIGSALEHTALNAVFATSADRRLHKEISKKYGIDLFEEKKGEDCSGRKIGELGFGYLGYEDPDVQKMIKEASSMAWKSWGYTIYRSCLCCVTGGFLNLVLPCFDFIKMPEYYDYYKKEVPASQPKYGRYGELVVILSCPGNRHPE